MSDDDIIPAIGEHKGVRLHDGQSAARLDLVRGEIDRVHEMDDAAALTAWAGDCSRSPESRLLAAARCEALWQLAAEAREVRPAVDLARLKAAVAGCDSAVWRDPDRYCSDLCSDRDRAVRREIPLEE
jgi:hypothetical protein